MVILVQRSLRPRRWAGVAFFAALVVAVWWTEHHDSASQAWLETSDGSFMAPTSEWTSAPDITGLVTPSVFSATTLIAPPANVAAEPSPAETRTEPAQLSIVDDGSPRGARP